MLNRSRNMVKKIVIIQPPHQNALDFPIDEEMLHNRKYRCEPPLGLWSLISNIKESFPEINIEIIDLNLLTLQEYLAGNINPEIYIDILLERIKRKTPELICISCMFTTSVKTCLRISQEIKKKFNAPILLGGGEVTNNTKLFLQEESIDYCLLGEGEFALNEFIEKFDATSKFDLGIAGLCYKNEVGQHILVPQRKYSKDLDEIPILNPDLLNFKSYAQTGRVAGLKDVEEVAIPYETSRGCPFQCTFCSAHTVWGRRIRYKSIARIALELDSIKEKIDFKYLYLQDDSPFLNKKRTLEILQEFKKREIVPFFPNSLRVNALDFDIIDAFADCGVYRINLAIESCNPETLKEKMNKSVDLDLADSLINYIRDETNIFVSGNILLGFPGETINDINKSIDKLRSLRLDWIHFGVLTPLPGSKIYDIALEKGYISGDVEDMNFCSGNLNTEDFTSAEIEKLVGQYNLDFNFINNVNIREKRWQRIIPEFEYVLSLAPHHAEAQKCLALCNQMTGAVEPL